MFLHSLVEYHTLSNNVLCQMDLSPSHIQFVWIYQLLYLQGPLIQYVDKTFTEMLCSHLCLYNYVNNFPSVTVLVMCLYQHARHY